LVTASDDGSVRLYLADHYDKPIKQFHLEGHDPESAVFSPDGQRVAVGYYDVPKVVVLSGADHLKLTQLALTVLSQDGRFLSAGGFWHPNDVWQIRRWSAGGKGPFVDIPAGSDTIMQILGLKSGSMLFASLKGFGLISPEGKIKQLRGYGALALNNGRGRTLTVAADGTTIQIDSMVPSHSYRFAVNDRRIDVDPPADSSLAAPVTKAPGLDVTNWHSLTDPAVNGTPIKLDQGTKPRHRSRH
jgi:hypothetical protein